MSKETPTQAAARKIEGALSRCKERESKTFGLYSVRFPRTKCSEECYYGPFLCATDALALATVSEISRSEPAFQRKNLYKVGSYCSLDGKVIGCKPRLILGKVKK